MAMSLIPRAIFPRWRRERHGGTPCLQNQLVITIPQDIVSKVPMDLDSSTNGPTTIALIGDGYVGKTCILKCIQKSSYQQNSSPNVYNEMTLERVVDGRKIFFKIIDTAGQEEYDELRKETYEKADIFLLCFCVADKVSYENITSKWLPDLLHYRGKPIILLGTKMDLRTNSSSASISRERGIKLQKRIGAKFYVECSSKSGEGISNIIDVASNVLLVSENKKTCSIQ